LSGGERARLALAILSLEGANFLLLDEPTNHLDIPAREALQEVLEAFSGTILLVSHDRYLIDRLATQVWDLRDGRLEVFKGSYREFLLRGAVATNKNGDARPDSRKLLLSTRPMARDNSKETRRRQEALDKVEMRIREQEAALRRLTAELQKNGTSRSYEKTHQLSWQVARAQAALDDLMKEWEQLAA
jgi:ATP-binding cassette, subfamily F, member 3